jgi:nucleoside 2-deoxyribosyltransferase
MRSMPSNGPTVYLAIKFHADHRNRALIDRVSAAFARHGLATVCVARDFEEWGRVSFEAHDLMRHALDAIRRSAAVVVEFSEKGVGLGIEAGYASALDIPVFVLLRPDAEVSTTLLGVSTEVFRYTDDDDLSNAVACIAKEINRGVLLVE